MKQQPKYFVVEAPLSEGSASQGSEKTYNFLCAKGLKTTINSAQFKRMCRVRPLFDFNGEAHNVKRVMRTNKRLLKVLVPAQQRGQTVVTVGGDHSVAIGTISSSLTVYGEKNVAVVYVDAHTDINTEKTSLSGNIHGMPLASVMGLCSPALTLCDKKLNGSNVFVVGARSIDSAEYGILQAQNVHVITAEEAKKQGIKSVAEQIVQSVQGKKVHISFDVDAIDGGEFASTGYVLPNGLGFSQITLFLQYVLQNADVVAVDCVEYNPRLDKTNDYKKVLEVLSLLNEK